MSEAAPQHRPRRHRHRRRRKRRHYRLTWRKLLAVLFCLSFAGVAWVLDVRAAEQNPALEWAILSLRYGGPLAAVGILLGSRFRSIGPSLALGFALWTGFLGALAVFLEVLRVLRIR